MYFISLSALKKSTTRFQQNELRGSCRSFSPEKRRSEPKHVDQTQTDWSWLCEAHVDFKTAPRTRRRRVEAESAPWPPRTAPARGAAVARTLVKRMKDRPQRTCVDRTK